MASERHNWVTFYNPRNGKVAIRACSKCGIAQGLEIAVKSCDVTEHHHNRMIAAGWQTTPVPA